MSQSKSSKEHAGTAEEEGSSTNYSRWVMLVLSVLSLALLLVVYLMPLALGWGGKGKASLMEMTPWMSVVTVPGKSKGKTIEEYAGGAALNMCMWSNEEDGGWEICEKGMKALNKALSRRQVTSGSAGDEKGEDEGSEIMDTIKKHSRSAMHLIIIPIIYLAIHTTLIIIMCFTKSRIHKSDLPVRHLFRANKDDPTPSDAALGIPGSGAKRFKAYRCVKGPIGKTLCVISAVALIVTFGVTMSLNGEGTLTPRQERMGMSAQQTSAGMGAWMVLVVLLCFIPMLYILWAKDLADPRQRGEVSKSKA